MLTHLFVSNYALIDQLDLSFNPGLSIITGETGAGKSIMLGALNLVLGERADLQAVQNKDKKCVIEATFDLSNLNLASYFEENDLDYEVSSILRRELLPSGKSRAFINDVPVKLSDLSDLSKKLIDVHSQFQTSELLSQNFQIKWIDAVANNQKNLSLYQKDLERFKVLSKEIDSIENRQEEYAKNKEYNLFLWNELNDASLEKEPLEELEIEQKKLENVDDLALMLSESLQFISREEMGIQTQITEVVQRMKKASFYSEWASQMLSRLESVQIELNDLNNEIETEAEQIEFNPERLAYVQNRLNTLNQLLTKHRVDSVEDLVQIKNDLTQRIESEEKYNENLKELLKEKETLEKRLNELSNLLTQKRLKAIPSIEKELISTVKRLGMEKAQCEIQITPTESFTSLGKDRINFLFTPNPGSPLLPIDKSVSGGEKSRLMLAIKKSLAHHLKLPTLILDEIDTGVSGKIANEMGNVMKEMSEDMQVITITHLPQVAAKGETHYKVLKLVRDGKTSTTVIELSPEQRVQEIAELLSGNELSEAAMQQAKELLQ